MEVETTTLWDLLVAPSITLHLPRFALFLLIAIPLEIYCDRKKVCLKCSIPLVVLQLFTGIGGVIAIHLMITASFFVGDRLNIPVWYYPLSGALLCFLTAIFLNGLKGQFRERLTASGAARGVMFGVTLYFAIATITTPSKINRVLEDGEKESFVAEEPVDSCPVTRAQHFLAWGTHAFRPMRR